MCDNGMNKLQQFPERVTIPTPMHTPRPRGDAANRGPHALGTLGDNIRVRITRFDRELIESCADELHMSKAEFARWCIVEVARALRTTP